MACGSHQCAQIGMCCLRERAASHGVVMGCLGFRFALRAVRRDVVDDFPRSVRVACAARKGLINFSGFQTCGNVHSNRLLNETLSIIFKCEQLRTKRQHGLEDLGIQAFCSHGMAWSDLLCLSGFGIGSRPKPSSEVPCRSV